MAIREVEASVAGLGCRTSSSASCLGEICNGKKWQVGVFGKSPWGRYSIVYFGARLCRELYAFWKISLLWPLGTGRDGMSHHGALQMTMWSELSS